MINFQSVTKHYGLVNGVNDVTMNVGIGAYGLFGPNGSGKTTLINLITGQLRPTIGTVRVFDQNPWGNQEMLSRVGLCPAVDVLYSNVTAFEWVNYQTRLLGFDWKTAKQLTENALSIVGMTDAMYRSIGGYSLGMRQRTKLAQAIAHEPDLLILDEPYNGLDPIGRQQMTEVLHGFLAKGKSVIMASHVLHEVEEISPSLLMLSNGRLLAEGDPKEIHEVLANQKNEIDNSIPDAFGVVNSEPAARKQHVEILIRCNDNYGFATQLFQNTRLSSIHFSKDESELKITTSSAQEVYNAIPEIVAKGSYQLNELRSADGSLDDLFSSLMKIHRGES